MTASDRATIVYVEDEEDDVVLLQHALMERRLPVELRVLRDGLEAVEYLSRNPMPAPRLILLDLNMPRLSGLEVLEWLRVNRPECRIPVVVFSSSDHTRDRQRARELLAADYLIKPCTFDGYLETVDALAQRFGFAAAP